MTGPPKYWETKNPLPKITRADGTLWEASYKTEVDAWLSCFNLNRPQFFFRQIEENPDRRWWTPWRPKYVRTGATWEGSDLFAAGFTVIRPAP